MILKFKDYDDLEDDIINNFDDLKTEFITIIRLKDIIYEKNNKVLFDRGWWEVVKDLLDRKNITFKVDPYDNWLSVKDPEVRKILDLSKDIIGVAIVYGRADMFSESDDLLKLRDGKITEKLVKRLEVYGLYPIQDPSKWFYNSLGSPRFYFPEKQAGLFLCGEIWLYKDNSESSYGS